MANGDDLDFRFRGGQFPTAALVQGVQQRAIEEQRQREAAIEREQSLVTAITQAAETGIKIAAQATEIAEIKQKRQNRKARAELIEQSFKKDIDPLESELSLLTDMIKRREGAVRPPVERGEARPLFGPKAQAIQGQQQQIDTGIQQRQADLQKQIGDIKGKAKLAGQFVSSDDPILQKAGLGLAGVGTPGEKRTFQKANLLLPDGTVELGRFDTATGKFLLADGTEAPRGTRQAFSEGSRFQFFTDATTGQRVKEDLITGERVLARAPEGDSPARAIEDLTIKQRQLVDKRVDRYTKDAVRSAAEASLSQINQIELVLATNVGFATGPLQGLVARTIAGEKGVLTDKDIARNSGNQALIPRFNQLLTKWQEGKLSTNNKKELTSIINAIKKNSRSKLERRVSSFKQGISKEFRLNADEVESTLLLPIFEFPVKPEFLSEDQKQKRTTKFQLNKPVKTGAITITKISGGR